MSAQEILAVMDAAEVRCGPELADAMVKARTAVAALIAERDALAQEVERLQANGVHTCGPHCQRIACVLRRERDALREALRAMLARHDPEAMYLTDENCAARAALATTGESA